MAYVLGDYGSMLDQRGDKATEGYLREALQYASKLTGKDRAYVAMIDNDLGDVAYRRGDLNEAERLDRAAIDEYRRLPEGTYVEMAATLSNLGAVLIKKGSYSQAEPWTRKALDYAQALDDAQLVSYTLMRRSNIATDARHAHDALTLAEAALLQRPLTSGLRAVALRQKAAAGKSRRRRQCQGIEDRRQEVDVPDGLGLHPRPEQPRLIEVLPSLTYGISQTRAELHRLREEQPEHSSGRGDNHCEPAD